MKKTCLAMLLILLSAGIVIAKAGKPTGPTQYNVTSTVANGPSTSPLVLESDNLNGGAYSITDPSVNSYVSVGSGSQVSEYSLNLSQQNVRTVNLRFDLLKPVGSSPDFPLSSGLYNATIFTRCYDDAGNTISLLTIQPQNALTNCSLRITFAIGGSNYTFVMAPPAAILPSGAPPTGRAMVACNSAASDGCNSWTITPYTGANATVADLVQIGVRGRYVVLGTYSGDTFQIDLQR